MNNWYNFELQIFIKTSLIQITHSHTTSHIPFFKSTHSFIHSRKKKDEGRIKGRKVKYKKIRIQQSFLEKDIILEKTVKRSTECLL
jgi:hypothetical protein